MYRPRVAETTSKVCCPGCGRSLQTEVKGVSIAVNSVTVDGQQIKIGPKKCELLRTLARTPGETVHREIIYGKLWGGDGEVFDKTIDTMVCRLNRDLRDTRVHVKCDRGVGYRLVVEGARKHKERQAACSN